MKKSLFALIFATISSAVSTQTVVASAGTLVVESDMTLAEAHFGDILIEADGITLDCAGHEVTGSGQQGGIFIRQRSNVTVNNCIVSGFKRGFLVDRSSGIRLIGNDATGNDWGYWISFSNDVQSIGNTAERNRNSGFYLGSSTRNWIKENHSIANGLSGFSLHDSDDNTLAQNIAESNEVAGFYLDFSHSNLLDGNISRANDSGFTLLNSSANTLIANEASGNSDPGYRFAEADRVYVADNTALNNGEDSYRIEGLTSIFEAPVQEAGSSLDAEKEPQKSQDTVGSAHSSSEGTVPNQILPTLRPEFIGLLLVVAAFIAFLIFNRPGRAWTILQRWNIAGGATSVEAPGGTSVHDQVPPTEASPRDEEGPPFFSSPSTSDVEDALRHIHNLAHLGTHEMSRMRLVQSRIPKDLPMTHVDLGRITQQVLIEAIDKFKPDEKRSARGPSPEWHQFLILHEAYIKRRLNRDIMADLYIGEGTFNRRRREAVRALVQLLDEWDRAEVTGPMQPIAF